MIVLFLVTAALLNVLQTTSYDSGFFALPDVELSANHATPQVVPNCPCSNEIDCENVQVQHEKEIFGFGSRNWELFDLDIVTTVAWAGDSAGTIFLCEAHRRNIRVIAGAPRNMPLDGNKTLEARWIDGVISMVKQRHIDGITFDYENQVTSDSKDIPRHYQRLINATTRALHAAVPGSQVSVCVAFSPDSIDRRVYDYLAISESGVDLLYVMAYDMQSQIYTRCIANANSPLSMAENGLRRYLELGVDRRKLILGLPWYGYNYKCVNAAYLLLCDGRVSQNDFCEIELQPFRGVNCSDAAGFEMNYTDVMKLYHSLPVENRSEVTVDASSQSPYFTFVTGEREVRQVWFDNPHSLSLKYQLAKRYDIRGVGPYRFDYLDPTRPSETRAMWSALRQYADKDSKFLVEAEVV